MQAYQADITYGTNSEFGFDYLRDNITMNWDQRVQRGHHYAIVDEVDNILIDEAALRSSFPVLHTRTLITTFAWRRWRAR